MSAQTQCKLFLTCDSEGIPDCPVHTETFVAETAEDAREDAERAGWVWFASLGKTLTVCPHCHKRGYP